jgi:hypothetical protein
MSRLLFIQADSKTLNPTLDQAAIDAEYAADPAVAAAEWGGLFRNDISAYLSDELIDAALPGRLKRGRRRAPVAFVDTSGGVADASVLAIAHLEDIVELGQHVPPIVVLDHLHAVDAPHKPDDVVALFAQTLQSYGLYRVVGDRYGAQWVVGSFEKHGIKYEPSELDKSAIYGEAQRLFAERRVEIIDDERLILELRLLERRPRPGGRPDAIDHPPRAHDDRANAAAGALQLAASKVANSLAVWQHLGKTEGERRSEAQAAQAARQASQPQANPNPIVQRAIDAVNAPPPDQLGAAGTAALERLGVLPKDPPRAYRVQDFRPGGVVAAERAAELQRAKDAKRAEIERENAKTREGLAERARREAVEESRR